MITVILVLVIINDKNMIYDRWTKEEDKMIISAYKSAKGRVIKLPDKLLMVRTRVQCWNRAYRLGIRRLKSGGYNAKWSKKLTVSEWNYFAGIIDGEGYVCVYPNSGQYRIGVGNTNYELIDWLQKKIGGQVKERTMVKKINGGWRKKAWEWTLDGKLTILSLLKKLLPYLIVKKDKVKKTIKLIQDNLDG